MLPDYYTEDIFWERKMRIHGVLTRIKNNNAYFVDVGKNYVEVSTLAYRVFTF